MISIFKNFIQENLSIIKIWIIYSLIINSLPFVIYFLGFSKVIDFTFKNYFFSIWGYLWDSEHYLSISQNGYKFPQQAFFPGYPVILKIISSIFSTEVAVKLNSFLLLPTLIQLKKLMLKMNLESKLINMSIIGFLCLPTAFFLQANYTETIYILISAWGLNNLMSSNYYKAILAGFFLSFIRISSVLYSSILFKKIYFDKKLPNGLKTKLLTILPTTFFGVLLYFYYLHIQFNDAGLFFSAQKLWGRVGFYSFLQFIGPVNNINVFSKFSEVITLIIGLILFIKTYKKINTDLYLFSLFHFLLPILTGSLLSLNRLFLYSYPVILYSMAKFSNNRKYFILCCIFMVILQIISIGLFMNEFFIG